MFLNKTGENFNLAKFSETWESDFNVLPNMVRFFVLHLFWHHHSNSNYIKTETMSLGSEFILAEFPLCSISFGVISFSFGVIFLSASDWSKNMWSCTATDTAHAQTMWLNRVQPLEHLFQKTWTFHRKT